MRFLSHEGLTYEDVEAFERRLLESPTVMEDPKQYYGQNVCVRTQFFPSGFVAVGKVHKYDHVSILLKGAMTIWTPEGTVTVRGPSITEVKAGMKRFGYAHEDTLWAIACGIPAQMHGATPDEFSEFQTLGTHKEFLQFIEERKQAWPIFPQETR